MWIGKQTYYGLLMKVDVAEKSVLENRMNEPVHRERIIGLERMNARLQSDLDWAKLRLNAVEKERAQLILAATGVKMAYPEFTPAYDPEKALNQIPDLSTIGGDAKEEKLEVDGLGREMEPNYSLLPGYRG